MKIDPLNILLNKDLKLNKKFYFISGNETSLMEKVCSTIITRHQEQQNSVKVKIDTINNFINEKGLFGDKRIFLGKNCKDINEKNLNNIKNTDDIFVFFHENSQKTKKIKNIFVKDSDSFLIDCYELNNDSKVKILNNFLNLKKIKIDEALYWLLVEKLDKRYAFLEDSLIKISELDKKDITPTNLKKILTTSVLGSGGLFFNLLKKNNEIVKLYREKIINASEANDFYYNCKFFCQLIIDSKDENEYSKKIPLYLFREKNLLIDIYRKYNLTKRKMLLHLLLSTEKLFRKHNSLSLISGLRFFLNIKKITIS